MPSEETPVTHWLSHLQAGNLDAAQPLWEHYFGRLVRLAQSRLPPAGDRDGEDVALSAFNSFCLAAARGRFPQLGDRNDLWHLLVFITAQKVANEIRRRSAAKWGGGTAHENGPALAGVLGREPSPEFAVMVADELRWRLDLLDDDILRQIALLKMENYTNREISERLGCSLRTVANKLGLIRRIWQAVEDA